MSVDNSAIEIEYPESDGKPMGETDLHRNWMVRIIDIMQYRYRGEEVYVSGDLLLYYEQGNPNKFFVPDAFVVLSCDPGMRRTFKIWEEERVPNAIFEVTSRSTKREDEGQKPAAFARIGVPEYFMYDPTSDYLDPPLRGFRLRDNQYVPIEPNDSGALESEQLDLLLRLEKQQLAMFDRKTEERLLMAAEAAEAEIKRLRRLLDERDHS